MKKVVQMLTSLIFLTAATSGQTHTEDVGHIHGDMIVSSKSFSYSQLDVYELSKKSIAPVDIDLLFLYTEGAKTFLGGQVSDVDDYIESQIAYLNMSFENSSLDITARNSGAKPWHYDFAPDEMRSSDVHGRFVPLTVIVPSSFKLDDLWPDGLMSLLGADVVVVVKAHDDGDNVCGFARVPNHEQLANTAHNQQVAILNVGASCQRDSLLAHELGHLLGSVHEDFDVTNDDYPDARAYGCGDNKTVLHSDPSGRVPYFSDPDLILDGLACGDITNANNKRVFELTSALLSSKTEPLVVAGSVSVSSNQTSVEEGATVSIVIERDGDLSNSAALELGFRNGTAQSNDYSASVSGLEFQPGESSISVDIGIVNDTASEAEETFTVYTRNLIGLSKGQSSEVTLIIAASDEVVNPPNPVDPGESSGGGSLGFSIFALLLTGVIRRKKINKII